MEFSLLKILILQISMKNAVLYKIHGYFLTAQIIFFFQKFSSLRLYHGIDIAFGGKLLMILFNYRLLCFFWIIIL